MPTRTRHRAGLAALALCSRLGCGPAPSTSPGDASVAAAPPPKAVAEPAPKPAPEPERPAVDIGTAAANEQIVFMHAEAGCEAWQFIQQGTRLERIDDETVGLTLSFAVGLRGPTALTLTDPQARSRGESVTLACTDGPPDERTLYLEEDDCRAGLRPILIKRGCPDALMSADKRGDALHRLEAERAAIMTARVQNAPALLAAFRRALSRRKAVYWRETNDEGARCDRWAVRKSRLIRTNPEGSVTQYGWDASIDRHSGLAQVSLTGPEWSGPQGSGGMGSWDVEPLVEVTDAYIVVGERRWYLSQDACRTL